ncbi:MAG: twin-arginine translocase TatA/TatE family subunit [Candidatus Dormibacteraeota bacterium]|uniref:Sec-independent protein translocase subunit TatA/TatB n=1 Tax=Candidatus Dormibacter sp. TaxID=2973982 RepID=UPI000DB37E85|nr:twin-arginine translocase TatA/TatE family subunit [Candidatus Dormibacteraeota bacterium]PZR71069.1 MAG: twin-arginine translocase TatA/TatE family subunit [Candidatus Dormibacteraeota bacterium]
MPFGIHPGFLLVLLIIVLVVFGPGKLGDIGGAVGRGMREFRKESEKMMNDVKTEPAAETPPVAPAAPVQAVASTPAAPTTVTPPVTPEPAKTETEKSA